jgi:hypothetical protein
MGVSGLFERLLRKLKRGMRWHSKVVKIKSEYGFWRDFGA